MHVVLIFIQNFNATDNMSYCYFLSFIYILMHGVLVYLWAICIPYT